MKKAMCIYLLEANRRKIEIMVKRHEARNLTHAIDKCIESYKCQKDRIGIRGEK